MTSRPPFQAEDDIVLLDEEEQDAPITARDVLAKYLRYALPEVATHSPTSALLLDQAITELMRAGTEDEPLVRTKYS